MDYTKRCIISSHEMRRSDSREERRPIDSHRRDERHEDKREDRREIKREDKRDRRDERRNSPPRDTKKPEIRKMPFIGKI